MKDDSSPVTVEEALDVADEAIKKAAFDALRLSPAVRVVYLLSLLECELAANGVAGWLINSSGRYASLTATALTDIGASRCAAILDEILGYFPNRSALADDEARVQKVKRVLPLAFPIWNQLCDQLLEWPDDVHGLLQKFVADHGAEFRRAGRASE